MVKDIQPARPCDYAPWSVVLEKLMESRENLPKGGEVNWGDQATPPAVVTDVMGFAGNVARPGWPEQHGHLADFALSFLEADVMLFRSGYLKRHLLRRLRQARLDARQKSRAEALIRRAVDEGTGLEEFREFCRLAVRVLTDDLRDWLTSMSRDVYITINDMDAVNIAKMAVFDEATQRKLSRYGRNWRPVYAVRPDFSLPIVKTSQLTVRNKIATNAWRMLRHIERTGN